MDIADSRGLGRRFQAVKCAIGSGGGSELPPRPAEAINECFKNWDGLSPPAKTHVCLVAYDALPAFAPGERGSYGGLETHAWLLACGLAQIPNLQVSMVVRHHRPVRTAAVNGVRIVTRVDRLFRMRRFVSEHVDIQSSGRMSLKRWNWNLLWMIPLLACLRPFRQPPKDPCEADPFFEALDADVFCCFGVNAVAATVIASARSQSVRSILFLESNADLDKQFVRDSNYVNPYGERGDHCRFAIDHADQIVSQTRFQQDLLKSQFERSSIIVNNPFDFEQWNHPCKISVNLPRTPFVLWIGRADRFHKRPHLLLDIVLECPQLQFVMVMNPGDPDVAQNIKSQLPAHVRLVDQVQFEEMPALFRGARLYVSTGSLEHEGFPNVFLQAAASGVPIASLEVDPGFVQREECGEVTGGNLSQLIESIKRITADSALAGHYAQNGRDYVQREHRLAAICERIERELIRDVVEPS